MRFVERTRSKLEDLLEIVESAWVFVEREVCGGSLIVQHIVGRGLLCAKNESLAAGIRVRAHRLLGNTQLQQLRTFRQTARSLRG
jgi:hypothetical protein